MHVEEKEEKNYLDVKHLGKLSESELKKKEGQLILAKLQNSDHVILLDDKGKLYSSLQFSRHHYWSIPLGEIK